MNENIQIAIGESGSRTVIRSLNNIANSADKAAASAENLKLALRFGGTSRSVGAVTNALALLRTELTTLSGSSSYITTLKNALSGLSGTNITNLVTALQKLNASSANITQFSRVLQQITTNANTIDMVTNALNRLAGGMATLQIFRAELANIVVMTPQIQALAAALRGLGSLKGDISGLATASKQLSKDIADAAKNAAAAQKSIQSMGQAGKSASTSFWDLKNSIAGVALYMVAGQVREWLDAWQSAAGIFKIATDNMEQMHIVQRDVTAAARDSRQDFSTTVDLYARLQRASQDVGASQREMIDFTKGVGTVLAIQHTSANQARGALIQLGQALGMQNIRAQEFRSMNENLYVVLQTVAKNMDGMGGSVNKLRQKMLSGKLASKDFFEAFLKGLPGLQEAFSKTSVTISQSFSVINTSFIETIGHLDDALGFSDKFGKSLIFIGKNLEYIIPLVIGAGIALAGAFGPAILGTAIGLMRTFMGILSANPTSALVATLATLAIHIALVKDQFLLGTQSVIQFNGKAVEVKATIGDLLSVLGGDVKNFFGAFWMVASDAMGKIGSVVATVLDDIGARLGKGSLGQELSAFFDVGESGFAGAILKVARTLDWMGAAVRSFILTFGVLFGEIPNIIEQSFKIGYNKMASGIDDMINGAIGKINEVRKSLGRPLLAERELPKVEVKPGYFDNLATELQNATKDAIAPLTDKSAWTFENYFRDVITRASALAEEQRKKELQAQLDLNKKNPPTLAPDAAPKTDKLKKEFEKVQNKVDPIGAARREQEDAIKVVTEYAARGTKEAKETEGYVALIKKHYLDAIEPLDAMVRDNKKAIELAGMDSEQRALATKLQEQINNLKKAGLAVDENNNLVNQDTIKQLQQQNIELEKRQRIGSAKDQIFNATVGKNQQIMAEREAATQMINDPNSKVGTTDVKNYFMQKTPDLFAGTQDAIDANLKLYDDMYAQIDFLTQNHIVSQQTAAQMEVNVKRKQQKETLDVIGAGMDNLATLTQSKNKDLARIGKVAAVASATIKGYEAVQNALATPLPWPIPQAFAATAAVAAAANVANIVNTPIGFMTGGEFMVGGNGGADSQMVAFRASPGERVAVQTPQQYRKGNPNQDSGKQDTPPAQIKVVNVLDPQIVGDYLSTSQGEQLVMNVIQRNATKVRNYTR